MRKTTERWRKGIRWDFTRDNVGHCGTLQMTLRCWQERSSYCRVVLGWRQEVRRAVWRLRKTWMRTVQEDRRQAGWIDWNTMRAVAQYSGNRMLRPYAPTGIKSIDNDDLIITTKHWYPFWQPGPWKPIAQFLLCNLACNFALWQLYQHRKS